MNNSQFEDLKLRISFNQNSECYLPLLNWNYNPCYACNAICVTKPSLISLQCT